MSWQQQQQRYSQRVNECLARQIEELPDHAPQLKQAMAYGLLNGGKRVRPFLIYAIGEACNVPLEQLDPCAMAIECIHSYSLIHDDLPAMDDDDLRRGQPTCHIAFDEATAILAGDALQTLAFDLLTHQPLDGINDKQRLQAIGILANASGYNGMCGGQAIDLASTEQQIDLNRLVELHNKKTGALINAAVQMAGVFCQLPAPQMDILKHYANAVGLAFQVQDDILDVVSDTQTLGKPQGSDLQAGKSTYPALLGLEGARQQAQQLYQQALQALHALPYNTDILQAFTAYIIQRDH